MIRRVVGFSLWVIGFILLAVLIPVAARAQDMIAGFAFVLLVVSCIALGTFMFLPDGLWNAVTSLLIVLGLCVPWFLIFLIPLPNNLQFLLAVFVALVAVLAYRRYYRQRYSSPKTSGGS